MEEEFDFPTYWNLYFPSKPPKENDERLPIIQKFVDYFQELRSNNHNFFVRKLLH
jgi:hypothetical protein